MIEKAVKIWDFESVCNNISNRKNVLFAFILNEIYFILLGITLKELRASLNLTEHNVIDNLSRVIGHESSTKKFLCNVYTSHFLFLENRAILWEGAG